MPLDHPEGCGCAVCRRHRERMESDPRYREIHAEHVEPEPAPQEVTHRYEPGPQPESVVESHVERVHVTHRQVVEHSQEQPRRVPSQGVVTRRGVRGGRGPRGRRGHHAGRTLLTAALVILLLHSFYPSLNVPGVPLITCGSTAGTSTAAYTGGGGVEQTGLGGKFKDLAEQTVGKAIKTVALAGLATAFHFAGDTVRAAVASPPSADNIASGLTSDVRKVGLVAGWVWSAFGGADVSALPGTTLESGDVVGASSGCGACPGVVAPAAAVGGGVLSTARAALRAGWTGQDAVTAVAIAGAESGYNPAAANTSSSARGLWQTMMSYHAAKYAGASWKDPAANARVAHQIWADAHGWSPWTTYTSGAYRSHLAEARAAVAKAGGTLLVAATVPVACAAGAADTAVGQAAVVTEARKYLGVPYLWGGTNPGTGLDCSGFVQLVYRNLGVTLPRVSYQQATVGTAVDGLSHAQPGDILAFGSPVHHVGIYIGGNQMIESPHTGARVRVSAVWAVPTHIRRVLVAPSTVAPVASVAAQTNGASFALATFNVLGASHHRQGLPAARMALSVGLLEKYGVDAVGLQEFQSVQAQAFNRLAGGSFGLCHSPRNTENAVAYRRSTFVMADCRTVMIPYFHGVPKPMTVARLTFRQGGGSFWLLNVHNPGDVAWAHHQQRYRNAATAQEVGILRGLMATGVPVFITGDANDRTEFTGPMRAAGMRGVSGTQVGRIDQIFGGPGTRILSHVSDRGAVVRRASDHPIVVARVAVGGSGT